MSSAPGPSSPRSPRGKQQLPFFRDLASAMELPFILVLAIVAGGGVGYLLDRVTHTRPWFLLLGGMAGFGMGVWRVIRDLDRQDKGTQ